MLINYKHVPCFLVDSDTFHHTAEPEGVLDEKHLGAAGHYRTIRRRVSLSFRVRHLSLHRVSAELPSGHRGHCWVKVLGPRTSLLAAVFVSSGNSNIYYYCGDKRALG